jgi:hypothetical protein
MTALALENHLDNLENKIEELLNAFEKHPETEQTNGQCYNQDEVTSTQAHVEEELRNKSSK